MSGVRPYTAADLARLRSVQARPQGWSHRVRPRVAEGRRPGTGERVKVILDELGNKVRMRRDGQDVKILGAPFIIGRFVNGRFENVEVR